MRPDFKDFEALILLAADERNGGAWASEFIINRRKRVRVSGQIPTATKHGLQLVALVNAMRSIHNTQAAALAEQAGVEKPRLLVIGDDGSFVDALNAIASRGYEDAFTPIKANRDYVSLLERQLTRFDVRAKLSDEGNNSLLALRHWSRFHHDKIALDTLPAALKPDIISAQL